MGPSKHRSRKTPADLRCALPYIDNGHVSDTILFRLRNAVILASTRPIPRLYPLLQRGDIWDLATQTMASRLPSLETIRFLLPR